MIRETKIKLPIYGGTVIILIADDMTELNAKYNLGVDESIDGAVWKKTTKKGYSKYLIALNVKSENHVLVHEVVHLVNCIFSNVDLKLDRDNDEAQAYLTGWLYRNIEREFNIYRNKKK